MPLYNNPHDYPEEKFVSYTWAIILAFVFGFFFWLHTVRWKIMLVYVAAMVAVCGLPTVYPYWPGIYVLTNAYFALMAPRICHERWKARGYRITDDSYSQIPYSYISFLKALYKIPSFWLF